MTHDERVARQLIGDMTKQAYAIADSQEPRYGTKALSPEQELRYWMAEDPMVDIEALRAQGVPETAIAAQRFPFRVPMMRGGGRALSLAKQVGYVERLNKRYDEWLTEQERERQAALATLMPPMLGGEGAGDAESVL